MTKKNVAATGKQSHAQSRFYGILDTAWVAPDLLASKCQALLDGGARIIQLRAKKESTSTKRTILKTILPLFDGTTATPILNDDCALALEFPGLGLHIGQDDMPVEDARQALGPNRCLGLSTHSPEQAADAISKAHLLDYFAVGPVFATQTKPDYTPVGLDLIRHVAALRPPLPWYAIGGITSANAREVFQAAAPGIVSVSHVLQATDTARAVSQFL